jgi:hypothetical protein
MLLLRRKETTLAVLLCKRMPLEIALGIIEYESLSGHARALLATCSGNTTASTYIC